MTNLHSLSQSIHWTVAYLKYLELNSLIFWNRKLFSLILHNPQSSLLLPQQIPCLQPIINTTLNMTDHCIVKQKIYIILKFTHFIEFAVNFRAYYVLLDFSSQFIYFICEGIKCRTTIFNIKLNSKVISYTTRVMRSS